MSEESATTSSSTCSSRAVGIVTQTVLLITSIATIAVVVAGIAVALLSRPWQKLPEHRATGGSDRHVCERSETLVAGSTHRTTSGADFASEGVTGYLVSREGGLPPALQGSGISDDEFDALLGCESISSRGRDGRGGRILIEGRPVTGGAVILTSVMSPESSARNSRRIAAAWRWAWLSPSAFPTLSRDGSPVLCATPGVAHVAGGERGLAPGASEVDIAEALNAERALQRPKVANESSTVGLSRCERHSRRSGLRGSSTTTSSTRATDKCATIGRGESFGPIHDFDPRLGAADFMSMRRRRCGEILTERQSVANSMRRCHLDAGKQRPHARDAMRLRQIIDNLMERLRVSPRGRIHLAIRRCDRRWLVRHRGSGQAPVCEDDLLSPSSCAARYRVCDRRHRIGWRLSIDSPHAWVGAAAVTSSPGFVLDQNPWRRARRPTCRRRRTTMETLDDQRRVTERPGAGGYRRCSSPNCRSAAGVYLRCGPDPAQVPEPNLLGLDCPCGACVAPTTCSATSRGWLITTSAAIFCRS